MCRSLRATPLPSRDVELSHLSVVSFACFFGPFLHSVKAISVHRAHRLLSESTRILCTLRTRPCARASRSHSPLHRKRGSQHHVSGCEIWRSRLSSVLIRPSKIGRASCRERV